MIAALFVTFVLQAPAAPMAVQAGSTIAVQESDFGRALAAAMLKKKVPVSVVMDKEKALFSMTSNENATKEGTGERVAKVLAFGVFAGSGKTFEATVTLTNRDGALVFAHNVKKKDIRGAAENVADELKKHIEKNKKAFATWSKPASWPF